MTEPAHVVVGPPDVDVGPDVIRLDGDGGPEVSESLAVLTSGLQGVADIVEQLRVAGVHLQAGAEETELVQPVAVPGDGLHRVASQGGDQQEGEAGPGEAPGLQPPPEFITAGRHQEREAHGGKVEDSLRHHEADREEEVGGGQEGEHDQAEAGDYHRGVLLAGGAQAAVGQVAQQGVEQDGEEVPGVGDGGDQGHRGHGPVTAEMVRRQEEPPVNWQQVVLGQLAARSPGSRGWVVVSETGDNVDTLTLSSFINI